MHILRTGGASDVRVEGQVLQDDGGPAHGVGWRC